MKTIRSALRVLCTALLAGCYVETDVSVTAGDDLYLDKMLLSIDSGEEIIEASVRHALNLLGLRDSFKIEKHEPKRATMEDYLMLTPTSRIELKKASKTGDQINITPIGAGKRKLVWRVEQRIQEFESESHRRGGDSANKVFLVINIAFPGSVDMANTSESKGNVYTWRITRAQMAKPFAIQAIYSTK